MASGSGMRPWPTSPLASSPCSAGITSQPISRSCSRLFWVAAWRYMSRSMAGHTSSGQRAESAVAVSIESQKPWASLAIVWAVAGATTKRSAHFPRVTCFVHDPSSFSGKISVSTSFSDRVPSVSGGMNRSASGVMSTCTSAPAFFRRRTRGAALYAAMLPVTPRITCRPDRSGREEGIETRWGNDRSKRSGRRGRRSREGGRRAACRQPDQVGFRRCVSPVPRFSSAGRTHSPE